MLDVGAGDPRGVCREVDDGSYLPEILLMGSRVVGTDVPRDSSVHDCGALRRLVGSGVEKQLERSVHVFSAFVVEVPRVNRWDASQPTDHDLFAGNDG